MASEQERTCLLKAIERAKAALQIERTTEEKIFPHRFNGTGWGLASFDQWIAQHEKTVKAYTAWQEAVDAYLNATSPLRKPES